MNAFESEGPLRILLELESRSAPLVALESMIYGLIATMALLGNVLVLVTVCKCSRLRNANGWLISSLAVSDVAMAVLCAPPTIAAFISGRWVSGFVVCQAQGYLTVWLACVSVETMALMAMDRYFRVLHPIRHRTLFASKRVKRYVVAVWLWAGTAPIPYVASGNVYVFHPGKLFCAHEELFSPSTCVVYVHVTASLLILTFGYAKVWRGLRANATRLRDVRQPPTRGAQITKEDVALTRTLFVTVLGFLSCWSPLLVMDFIAMVNGQWSLKRWSFVMFCDMGMLSSCVNPIIYGAMNKAFRSQYMTIFTKKTRNSENGSGETGSTQ